MPKLTFVLGRLTLYPKAANLFLLGAILAPQLTATCITGGPVNPGICFSDTAVVQAPSDWYWSNTISGGGSGQLGALLTAPDLPSLIGLIQSDYDQITSFSSLTFQGGKTGFVNAGVAKVTNLQLFQFITNLTFLNVGSVDLTVQPEVGNGFGPFAIGPPPAAVPEPASLALISFGLTALALARRRR